MSDTSDEFDLIEHDGELCQGTCNHCGHRHVYDHTGRCLSGSPMSWLPLVGETAPTPCPCPFPHGIVDRSADRLTEEQLDNLARWASATTGSVLPSSIPSNVRCMVDEIRALRTLVGAPADHAAAIARDISLGLTSQKIRDEIIAKVGMMAYSRTPEMQARFDAAVAREHGHAAHVDTRSVYITISGPQNSDKIPIARGILELLQGADISCSMPEEPSNPYDGDSIEQLGNLHRTDIHVTIQTQDV